MQTPYFPIEISDSLWLPLLRYNPIDMQISIPCSRPTSTRKRKSKRKQKNRTLFVFYNNESWGTLFFSATTSDLEDNSEGRHAYSPLLVFYSITISRVLKITIECRFIDDFSQTKIDLVLKNIDLCVAKKIKFCHFIYVVFNFLLKYFLLLIFSFPMSLLYHCC